MNNDFYAYQKHIKLSWSNWNLANSNTDVV